MFVCEHMIMNNVVILKYKILVYIVITLSSLALLSCDKTSELSLLNLQVDKMVSAVENHKIGDVKTILANDFLTVKSLNKIQFLLFVNHQFKRNKNISISVLDKDVKLNEKNADVTFKVLLLGSNDWLPERGQIYNVSSRWKKENGDWVMSRLRWEKN